MRTFIYRAKNDKGQIVTGTVKAADSLGAEKILTSHNLVATDISQNQLSSFMSLGFGKKITTKEKALFARQLSTMISAGLTLPKAVKIISAQTKKPALHEIFVEVYRALEEGQNFSGALSKHPDVFDQVFVSIISAGEATGKLDTVLKQLAEQLENDDNFSGKVRGALYYPAFILVALVAIGTYMLIVVIPQLKVVFDQMGAKLPIATRALLAISAFVQTRWWVLLIVVVAIIFFTRFWIKSPSGSEEWDLVKIKAPGYKKLSQGIYMYRFTRIMAMLIGTGVPLLDALKVGSSVMNNKIYEKSINNLAKQAEKGVPLSVQMVKDPYFPSLIGQMVSVGEETGRLDQVLDKVADYYEQETEQAIKTISTLIEPIVIVLMGCAVAFLVFAVLVPIYNIAQLQ